jgi:hypothetical protein
MEDAGIFCGQLVNFPVIWYILRHFGIFWYILVYFGVIWYILRHFGIFCGHLVYFLRFGRPLVLVLVAAKIWQPCLKLLGAYLHTYCVPTYLVNAYILIAYLPFWQRSTGVVVKLRKRRRNKENG